MSPDQTANTSTSVSSPLSKGGVSVFKKHWKMMLGGLALVILLAGSTAVYYLSQQEQDIASSANFSCWCTGQDQCPVSNGWQWSGGAGYCSENLKCCTEPGKPVPGDVSQPAPQQPTQPTQPSEQNKKAGDTCVYGKSLPSEGGCDGDGPLFCLRCPSNTNKYTQTVCTYDSSPGGSHHISVCGGLVGSQPNPNPVCTPGQRGACGTAGGCSNPQMLKICQPNGTWGNCVNSPDLCQYNTEEKNGAKEPIGLNTSCQDPDGCICATAQGSWDIGPSEICANAPTNQDPGSGGPNPTTPGGNCPDGSATVVRSDLHICPSGDTNGDGECTAGDENHYVQNFDGKYQTAPSGQSCWQIDYYRVSLAESESSWAGGGDGGYCGHMGDPATNCQKPPSNPQPSPSTVASPSTPVGPMCLNITMNPAAPKMGDQISFTCGVVAGVNKYEFRVRKPDNSITNLAATSAGSNTSQPLTITTAGTYQAQCRVCTGNSCSEWEAL